MSLISCLRIHEFSFTASTNKRKQTLLALLDELVQLREEEQEQEKDINYTSATDKPLSSDDKGVERFQVFDKRIRNLDRKLLALANAVRQLGSSAGLLIAVYHLRARLAQTQYFFRENAAELFDSISHSPNIGTKPYSVRRYKKTRRPAGLSLSNTSNKLWSSDTEHLPQELESLAQDFRLFLGHLNDTSEFIDEAVNDSIMDFEADLLYRASCLREFKGQFQVVAVAQYINDLTEDLGGHLDSVETSLHMFIKVVVPQMRLSQERAAAGLLNLSAVATFFSGVTATTLQRALNPINYQFSFDDHGSPLPDLVNVLWISGLVLSIASAINSQLAYHWRAAMCRSPQNYVPWWAAVWITRTPLIFLAMSVLAFSTGLCAFTYSSSQSPAVSAVVMSFTGVTSFSLLCVGVWFTLERWTLARTKGNTWLLHVLEEYTDKAGNAISAKTAKYAVSWTTKRTRSLTNMLARFLGKTARHVADVIGRMTRAITSIFNSVRATFARELPSTAIVADGLSAGGQKDTESQEGNMETKSPVGKSDIGGGSEYLSVKDRMKQKSFSDAVPKDRQLNINPAAPEIVISCADDTPGNLGLDSGSGDNGAASFEPPERNARFVHIARTSRPRVHSRDPVRSTTTMSERLHRRDLGKPRMDPTRMQSLVSTLRTLGSSQMLDDHATFVKHLQFSPDGRFLATCSCDKTTLIWRVGAEPLDDFAVAHTLVNTSRSGDVEQVAWSPGGDQLLTKQLMTVKVWDTETGVCKKTIVRKRNVRSITWMPKGPGFVSVEWQLSANSVEAKKWVHHADNIRGSGLAIMNADGTVMDDHYLPRLQVWDVAVTPDGVRVVAVASLLSSVDNLKPMKSRNEKRILVYNLQTKSIENQVPLLQEVRDVTLSEQGNYALVSYENQAPPQAWHIDMIGSEQECQLVLAHTYSTKDSVEFAGPSYFGGVNDTFVLCASKSGEIYIWERESGILLHSLKAPDQELTHIAWNHKSPSGFMLASAAHDGIVRIWTTTTRPTVALSPELVETDNPSLGQTQFLRSDIPRMASPAPMGPGFSY
ncbi:WD40 repeat-like protein [Ceratobasidium sp. AG-I]|nr:WD40 repeat-like protein [Ceratobasidium sp. AG-I]